MLTPARKVLYQFSARGHEVTQALLAQLLTGQRDGVASYYRSRPLMLALGLPLDDALSSTMMRSGGFSDGRDIGVVFNLPNLDGPCVLPACGGVGTQYTPAVGWAQALRYHSDVLGDDRYAGSIAVAQVAMPRRHQRFLGRPQHRHHAAPADALLHRRQRLRHIGPSSTLQTPGGNIAKNLAGFRGLHILDGDGDRSAAGRRTDGRGNCARAERRAARCLLHLNVPRLEAIRSKIPRPTSPEELSRPTWAADPLPKLKAHMAPVADQRRRMERA